MGKYIKINLRLCIIICSIIFCNKTTAQVDVIEIDTITNNCTKGLPYNKPVTLKVRIQTETVNHVFRIEKYRDKDLSGSIGHYIRKSNNNNYILPEIPSKYYYVKKIGDFNYLFVTFADEYVLKPSTAYYLALIQPKADPLAIAFFDKCYSYIRNNNPADTLAAREILEKLDNKLAGVFGNLNLGWYSVNAFNSNRNDFFASFNTIMLTPYNEFTTVKNNLNTYLSNQTNLIINNSYPITDSLTNTLLLLDSSINKEAIQYLFTKETQLNEITSDLQTISIQAKFNKLLSGKIALGTIYADTAKETAYPKRISNIENSITLVSGLKRALFLLKAKYRTAEFSDNSIVNCQNVITTLQSVRDSLKKIIAKREVIDEKIATERFATGPNSSQDFAYYAIVSGDSYLNFETRNKVLITPDFGVVTSAFTKAGKELDYGIIPYIGFHINFMALDKDITFKSYKKNWKQRFSFLVGWSLSNMNQDSTYSSFFEKGSVLTGFGFRLSNAVRITYGTQWLFKLGKDANSNQTKKLIALPFAGLSFDFNVKQYLNGLTDILSGIGKTKNSAINQTSTITP